MRRLSEDEAQQYGFRYGPVDVTRLTSDTPHGHHVIEVATDHQRITIAVSKTGRSVRVWRGDVRLVSESKGSPA